MTTKSECLINGRKIAAGEPHEGQYTDARVEIMSVMKIIECNKYSDTHMPGGVKTEDISGLGIVTEQYIGCEIAGRVCPSTSCVQGAHQRITIPGKKI